MSISVIPDSDFGSSGFWFGASGTFGVQRKLEWLRNDEIPPTPEESIYHLFGGEYYYPEGGVRDYLGSFSTIGEAIEHWDNERSEWLDSDQWAHIAVVKDGKITVFMHWYRDHKTARYGWKRK